MEDKIEMIAMIAHEVNKAYCESIGDNSQLPWDLAPDWQKESAMNGVVFNMKNPDATAADNHASWLELKLAEGWTLGETKDPIAKTHPCMVPYDELPKDQQTKDALYAAVVKTALAWCS